MQTQPLLICLAKALRTFGFGMVSVMLGVFLKERGFSLAEIGLLISATLVEDAVLSTLISYYANKLGYKNILLASSLLVVVSGVVLGVAADRLTLILAIVLGIISPAGFEGGPFASIEHSLITQAVNRNVKTPNKIQTQSHLTSHFSFYNLAGFGGAALGSLLCGVLMALFPGDVSQAFSVIFFVMQRAVWLWLLYIRSLKFLQVWLPLLLLLLLLLRQICHQQFRFHLRNVKSAYGDLLGCKAWMLLVAALLFRL